MLKLVTTAGTVISFVYLYLVTFRGSTFTADDNPCKPSPCNGGSCEVFGSTFQCNCPPDLTGPSCTTVVDPCKHNPCKNGGACVPYFKTNFICKCVGGYSGSTCTKA